MRDHSKRLGRGGRPGALSVWLLTVIPLLFPGACSAPGSNGLGKSDHPSVALAERLASLDQVASSEMERWGVPGLALGVVVGDELAFAKGYGFRDPELKLGVTPRTNFGLASMTKAFTALTIGTVLEDRAISWDTPVQEVVPAFRLSDSTRSSQVTFRDLLSHRTGLADKDELWTSGELRARGILEHLHELEVAGPLRGRFEYSNVLYIAAAETVKDLIGRSWTTIARERLLTPLGMERTGFSVEELLQSDEFSHTFSETEGRFDANEFPGPEHNAWYFPRGSGSMFSNVDDMSRWMAFQLSVGTADSSRIILGEIVRATHSPQIRIDEPSFYLAYDGITDHAYGIGWFIDNYRGHKRIHHGGASMGYSDYITLFPDDGIGIVILSNRQVLMPVELMYLASDLLLDLSPEPWEARFSELVPGE